MASVIKHVVTLMTDYQKGRLPGILCLAVTAGILAACLWPFDLHPVNKVMRLQNENGLRFQGRGIVFSQEPFKMPGSVSKSDDVTIELLVRPGKGSGSPWGAILTLFDRDQEQFILGQWKANFNIRIPAENSIFRRSYRHLGLVNALPKDATRLITVTSGRDETDIYVDGKLEENAPHYTLLPAGRQLSGYLVLGNSPDGANPWNGDLLGMAIYGRPMNGKEILDHFRSWRTLGRPPLEKGQKLIALYLFDERNGRLIRDRSDAGNHLEVPVSSEPLHKNILLAPWNDRWFSFHYAADIIVNILGFTPFGFFLAAWLRYAKDLPAARVYGLAVLLGFCLSLAIELAQAYIPTRGSQLMDVITNTAGTALGSRVLLKFASRDRAERARRTS